MNMVKGGQVSKSMNVQKTAKFSHLGSLKMNMSARVAERFKKKAAVKKAKTEDDVTQFVEGFGGVGEDGKVHYPTFTVPLMNFKDDKVSDDDDCDDQVCKGGVLEPRSVIRARKKWKNIYGLICGSVEDLPLRQMMLKKKHEDQIFKKM